VLDSNTTQPVKPEPALQPPAAPPQPQAVVEPGIELSAPGQSYSWQASEYTFHEKSAAWYLVFWIVIAVICGILALLRQWLSIAVVAVMALAVVVYSRKQPRTLIYSIDSAGISIDGRVHPFTDFRSFSILQEVAWHEIDLEPAKRFSPRLTLLCESDDMDVIEGVLGGYLPRADRHPDLIERASRYLRF
jgi:hypothetical protein